MSDTPGLDFRRFKTKQMNIYKRGGRSVIFGVVNFCGKLLMSGLRAGTALVRLSDSSTA